MLSAVIALYTLASVVMLQAPYATANCDFPAWAPILSNPLQSGSGTITSSPNHPVSGVKRLGNNTYNGLKFMAADDNGQSIMGLYAPGDAKWTVQAGYTDAKFTDFYMINVGKEGSDDMYLFYVNNNKELHIVTQSGDSTSWSNDQVIYSDSNGIRFPQAQIIKGNLYVAIQSATTGTITLLYRGENDTSFSNWGIPIFPGTEPFVTDGQYSMFQGSINGLGLRTLWFYYMPAAAPAFSFPNVVYTFILESGQTVQLSTPYPVGDFPLYNISSLSAVGSDDSFQGMLFRTGFIDQDYPVAYGWYNVIKLTDNPINETCSEQIISWSPSWSDQVASVWAPVLISGALSSGTVSAVWVNSTDGTLNAASGSPW